MLQAVFRNSIWNLIAVFTGKSLLWHFFAIALTAAAVLSGTDWRFFEITRSSFFHPVIWIAGVGGFFTPVLIPLAIYLIGELRKRRGLILMGAAAGQAALIAYLISIAYKAATGRMEPGFLTTYVMVDNSRSFNFGFLEYGVFWGWPSSHTAVAFAVTFAIIFLTRNALVRALVLSHAVFIGIGAAIGFHWLSDVLAGAIIGALTGIVVAKSFRE